MPALFIHAVDDTFIRSKHSQQIFQNWHGEKILLEAREPNDLDQIRALRRDPVDALPFSLSEAELLDRLHGA